MLAYLVFKLKLELWFNFSLQMQRNAQMYLIRGGLVKAGSWTTPRINSTPPLFLYGDFMEEHKKSDLEFAEMHVDESQCFWENVFLERWNKIKPFFRWVTSAVCSQRRKWSFSKKRPSSHLTGGGARVSCGWLLHLALGSLNLCRSQSGETCCPVSALGVSRRSQHLQQGNDLKPLKAAKNRQEENSEVEVSCKESWS